jgi:hypothetical protein
VKGAIVYIINYEGNKDPAREWQFSSYGAAIEMIEELEGQYPDRKWYIVEHNVS